MMPKSNTGATQRGKAAPRQNRSFVDVNECAIEDTESSSEYDDFDKEESLAEKQIFFKRIQQTKNAPCRFSLIAALMNSRPRHVTANNRTSAPIEAVSLPELLSDGPSADLLQHDLCFYGIRRSLLVTNELRLDFKCEAGGAQPMAWTTAWNSTIPCQEDMQQGTTFPVELSEHLRRDVVQEHAQTCPRCHWHAFNLCPLFTSDYTKYSGRALAHSVDRPLLMSLSRRPGEDIVDPVSLNYEEYQVW
ncbi:hypothetical protein CCHR01_19853 [Colletotrichum chrysophilum]|uniref:DUF3295 domain-containing protein n=1 Tax=Colletotrichum chrysophilum TaxID=1836956 RepID=A0AAD9E6V2_9PEZI|nr:hypothetical protein CCHR01_19853 [Colletotrichum chrysophilum]